VVYETPFVGSLLYNLPAIGVSGIICGVLLMMLFPTLLRFRPQPFLQNEVEESKQQ
jgi:hypothetical protein